jgi:hypothetical protein
MKNIQVIDGAENCVYDVFSATDEEFDLIFQEGTDIAFIDEVFKKEDNAVLIAVFNNIWNRRLVKAEVNGIHGILFYQLEHKKEYYPSRRDEEAVNPDGSPLR